MHPLLELFSRDLVGLPDAAARHGLSGYVLHLAELEPGAFVLPDPTRVRLRRDARMIAGQSLRVKAVLLRTLEALETAGIVPVLLKGYGAGLRLYPAPLMRAASD